MGIEIHLTDEQQKACDNALNFLQEKASAYSSKLYTRAGMWNILGGKKPIIVERVFWYADGYKAPLKPYIYVVFTFGDEKDSHGGYYLFDDLEGAWGSILQGWEQDAISCGIISKRTKV